MGLEVISIKSFVLKQSLHTGFLGISERPSLVGSLSSAVHSSLPFDYNNLLSPFTCLISVSPSCRLSEHCYQRDGLHPLSLQLTVLISSLGQVPMIHLTSYFYSVPPGLSLPSLAKITYSVSALRAYRVSEG